MESSRDEEGRNKDETIRVDSTADGFLHYSIWSCGLDESKRMRSTATKWNGYAILWMRVRLQCRAAGRFTTVETIFMIEDSPEDGCSRSLSLVLYTFAVASQKSKIEDDRGEYSRNKVLVLQSSLSATP